MAQANFSFISDASGGDQFTVVSFSASEALSSPYQYVIEIKSPLSAEIDLDDVLDNPARFVTELDGEEYPVYGVLSSFDEMQTVQGYVYYRAELVPKLWWLSIYRTNEIFTEEKTVDKIIQTVLEKAGFTSGTDFDLGGLDTSKFLIRDYVCQFGESDLDFISRLMENEGIFYYFEHDSGSVEKIVFINDMNYLKMPRPELIFDVKAQTSRQHDCINAWSCRKQRLPESVSVRDFNPEQPSLDISDTMPVDNMGQGTEYLYGVNVRDGDEATYLSQIRAEERLCSKTRYYGESSVTRLQAGYLFSMDGHPNSNYNGAEYLAIEVSHEGRHLDMAMSAASSGRSQTTPQYLNSFVAMDATEQYRPPQKTPKPRFFGTMTAFVYAETGKKNAEVDLEGRYRVHLPFDRADGTKDSSDPNRKASTWIRMAQPYVGQEQGMYFPLADGTEVLLTFINGDPDQPIISGALPNASQPSLLNSEMNLQRTITAQVSQTVSGNTHRISMNSARLALLEDPPSAANPTDLGSMYMNEGDTQATLPPQVSMIPPWDHQPLTADKPAYDENYIKFMMYDEDYAATDMDRDDIDKVSTDRGAGDNYVYANARTFAYPQHERVFFIGTFHEDFHLKDDFLDTENSWTGEREQFNFPAPGADYPDGTDAATDPDATVNPDGIRGVTEDKRWGDQMFYAYGRTFAWSAGKQMGEGGAFGTFNYGNGYTENLVGETGGTEAGDSTDVSDAIKAYRNHNDKWDYTTTWEPSPLGGMGPGWKGFADVIGLKFLRGESKKEGLVAATKLDPDITLADKTFGHTYSYHMGLAVNIHEGNSRSRTYGNTEDKVNGDSESVVTGDSYATTYGRKTELTIGADTEIKLASDTEVKCAMDNTFHLGVKTDLSFSGDFGFNFGVAVEGHLVNLIVDKIKAKKEEVALQSRLSALENVQAKIAKTTIQILSGNVTCGNKTLAIHNNSFTLNS